MFFGSAATPRVVAAVSGNEVVVRNPGLERGVEVGDPREQIVCLAWCRGQVF